MSDNRAMCLEDVYERVFEEAACSLGSNILKEREVLKIAPKEPRNEQERTALKLENRTIKAEKEVLQGNARRATDDAERFANKNNRDALRAQAASFVKRGFQEVANVDRIATALMMMAAQSGTPRTRAADAGGMRAIMKNGAVHDLNLDRIVLVKPLGRGSFGLVLQAVKFSRSLRTKKVVAIKLLMDPAYRADELHAAAQQARIKGHRNVVGGVAPIVVNGAHGAPRCVAFTMDYANNGTLQDFVDAAPDSFRSRRSRAQHVHDCVFLLLHVVNAILALHDLGYVHLDLKPDNIVLDWTRTRGNVARITDFGLTEKIGDVVYSQVGTVEFMAPELAPGRRTVLSGALDIFSLGALVPIVLFGEDTQGLDLSSESHVTLALLRLAEHCRDANPAARPSAGNLLERVGAICRMLPRLPTDVDAGAAAPAAAPLPCSVRSSCVKPTAPQTLTGVSVSAASVTGVSIPSCATTDSAPCSPDLSPGASCAASA